MFCFCFAYFSGREVERSEDGGITVEASDFEDPAGEVLQYRCGHTPKDGKPQVITSWSTSSTCENLDLPSGMNYTAKQSPCISGKRLAGETRSAQIRMHRLSTVHVHLFPIVLFENAFHPHDIMCFYFF